ncbi:MAG: tRNA epoxyqueuosine(34) reductase QueG [Hyphomonadaceae bacterium]
MDMKISSARRDAEALKTEARALGFDAVGIASANQQWEAGARLEQFLALGRHGDMTWMQAPGPPAAGVNRRAHPTALWSSAKTAIVVGQSYAPETSSLALLAAKQHGLVSAYAARRDYHDILKGKLKQLAQWLVRETSEDAKVFVDTAPLLEKPLAERAGLGWQGKHTNLVSREHGSWLFLGAILSAAELEPDKRYADHCGSCRACLDVCPTDAFPAPYQLDARRCLAYLSIESKAQIPRAFRQALGNRVFGCDDCLAVCPWNKFAQASRETRLALRTELRLARLDDLAALDDASFRVRFAGTPVKRTGRDRFVRNVVCAIGNSDDRSLAPAAERLLDDSSPLVRGMAVWALRQLLDAAAFQRLKSAHAPREGDASVAEEWDG